VRLRRRALRAGAGVLFLSPRGADRARHRMGYALSARLRVGVFSGSGPRRRCDEEDDGEIGGMANYQFKLPDVGEGTAEAEIVAWHVKVGDRIKEDQPLVDMMTDKATVELSSPVEGVVESINGKAGDKAAVGSVLVTMQVAGAGNAPDAAAAKPAPTAKAEPAPKAEPKPEPK